MCNNKLQCAICSVFSFMVVFSKMSFSEMSCLDDVHCKMQFSLVLFCFVMCFFLNVMMFCKLCFFLLYVTRQSNFPWINKVL